MADSTINDLQTYSKEDAIGGFFPLQKGNGNGKYPFADITNVIDIVYESTPFATLKSAYDNGQSVRLTTTTSGVQIVSIFQPVYKQNDASSDSIQDAVVFSNTYGNPNGQEQYAMNVLTIKKGDENDSDDWSLVAKQIGGGVGEAPNDGNSFVRKNKSWVEFSGGASVGKVIYDTSTYAEVVAAFENNDFVTITLPDDQSSLVEGYGVDADYVNMLVVVIGGYVLFTVTSDNSWTYENTKFVEKAPEDSKAYGRKDTNWVEVAEKSYVDNMLGNVENMLAAL